MESGKFPPPEENGGEDENERPSPSRMLALWFVVILGVSAASAAWLSVRSESPAHIRGVLDLFLHGATGAAVAYFAFRALFLYPFRMVDLFTIVLLLSGAMKLTLDVMTSFANIGILRRDPMETERLGEMLQVCLIFGSVLLAGAAYGLRNCHALKLESSLVRVVTVASGMLALPAAAGTAAFLVPVFQSLVNSFKSKEAPTQAFPWLLLWFLSLAITGINVLLFVRALALTAEVSAKEQMPK